MTGRIRSRFGRGGAQPPAADVEDADGRRCLDSRGQCAQDDAENRPLLLGQGEPGDQQPEHQRVVVSTADEIEDDHRIEDGQGEELGPVTVVELGQARDAYGDQDDPSQGQEPQEHDGGQLVVEGDPSEEPVDLQEERAIWRGRIAPQRIDRRRKGVVAQLEGSVEVRIHVAADHLALGRGAGSRRPG